MSYRVDIGSIARVVYPPPPTSVRRSSPARAAASHSSASWRERSAGPQGFAPGEALASELVTNAVIHGEGRIVLRTRASEDSLLVEVIDEGYGFEYELRRREGKGLG
jgi:anti-sigma regulatory factor (Ser/Thr protein kinase)